MLIIFALVLSNVVNAATQCEVDQIKQALRKMLYRFYSNPNNAPFSVTEVKDLLIFYLSIDPNAVTIDCSVLGSSSNKAIFDIINMGKNVSDEIPKCTDGTQYGQCSGNRPKYCYAGAIYEKCETCGCPSNSFCGKSGKCESTIQNITCYNNIDCGTNKFVGDYYCSSDSIYKNLLNYTCVNAGTANASCAAVNGSVWIAYCNPNLNQVCVNGQNTCQTKVKDNAPTAAITANPSSVAAGQAFNVTVTGTDDIGLAAIWWWAVDSTDTELNKAHWYSCYNAKYCSNSWLVSTNAVGTIKLGANSRDTSYPVAGEAHQASEGYGIAYVTITVTGATNVSNVSGELPDLIISDFKSYTGTTNTYVTISATIKNIGGSVTIGNLCDGLYVETLNARGFCGAKLNPGETRVIQSDYALPMPGTYKIRADTDYGLLVAESNENNNVAWQTITVTSPYSADYVKANTDLTVTDIDVQLPTTSSGSTTVYITTKNLGSLATGQYWVLTKVTNVDTGKITNVQRLAPIVQPGGTYSTHHGSVGIIEYGTYKVEAWVDYSNYIPESDENNNYMVKTIVYGNQTTTSPTRVSADFSYSYDLSSSVAVVLPMINFQFPSADITDKNIKHLRLYNKKPGESVFSKVAEFTDLPTTPGSATTAFGGWKLSFTFSPSSWLIYKVTSTGANDHQPASNYAVGAHSYYITAVDSSGRESNPSVISTINILSPITILSPISTQSPVSSTPTFQWTLPAGWPSYTSPTYLIYVIDQALNKYHWQGNSKSSELVYNGPTLDPAKKYSVMIQVEVSINEQEMYFTTSNNLAQFWVSNQTTNLTLLAPTQMRAAMNTPNASMVPTVNFVYSATDISYYNIKSFRLYQKKPGESVFSRVAEFTNLPTTASSTGTVAGQWRLVFSAPEIGGWWAYKINSLGQMDYQPVANYPLGTYYYYVTAVDAFGRESQQSVVAIEHILEPVTILSPTTSQSPTPTKPTVKWTIATGWPFTPAHHIYVIDPALPSVAYWYKLHSGWDGSVVYDGPALDPTKKYIVMITARMYTKDEESYLSHNAKTETFWASTSTNNTNQTSQQTCTGISKTVDFEDPPHLSFHLTWNPDLGTQDSYNYNLDETARTWLKGKGLVINGTPNGIVWGTQHSGPAGNTGVVIGDASPNFVENDQGISDNEILSVRFIDALTKSVTVGLTVIPSNVSLINNIPATVTLEAYDASNNIVGTATKTFTGVTNGVYTPTTMSLSATDFKIAKITLRATQHPYGGVWLEDVNFLSCT